MDLGLTSSDDIDVDGTNVKPRGILRELLVRHLPADGPDVVLIRLEFRGRWDGESRTLRYDIIDKFDESTGLSAMMRTTAFPASIIAQMMARGDISQKGAIPQERCVPPQLFIDELAARNIRIFEAQTQAR
jgi:saccharopine dehydrogenase-like NADP-dependent oxidoreductase